MRLQKFIAHAGICSRRKAEDFIAQGKVSVNGQVVETPGTKINPDHDDIRVCGKKISRTTKHIYIALNKPRGVVTSCKHPGEKIVTDLVNLSERLFPVGRLDKDSTGLLLLTNDGSLHHRVSHPSFDHEKEYIVSVHAAISDYALKQMANGIILDGEKTRPAVVQRRGAKKFHIVLKQGRNRQIRRMLESLDYRVHMLHRIRIGMISIKNLKKGEWRYLSKKEIRCFDSK